jgi:hypothetical protein
MSQLNLVKAYIADMDDDEFTQFRDWYFEFDRVRVAADPDTGRLGNLIAEVLQENQSEVLRISDARA